MIELSKQFDYLKLGVVIKLSLHLRSMAVIHL